MIHPHKWPMNGKIGAVIVLGSAIFGAGGAVIGWRTAPTGAAESPEIARQIAELQKLRDSVRRELDETRAELAKRAAQPPANRGPNTGAQTKPEPVAPAPPDISPAGNQTASARPNAAGEWRKAVDQAFAASDVHQAIALLQRAASNANQPERSQIEALLDQSQRALPEAVLARLQELIAGADNNQIDQWIASGEPPGAWTQDLSSPQAVQAFRQAAMKLLPIAWHNREQPYFEQRVLRHLDGTSFEALSRMSPYYAFRELTQLYRQGQLDAEAMKEVSELYGAFGAERFLPAVRGLIVAGMDLDAQKTFRAVPLTGREDDAVRGDLDPLSCAALFAKCRLSAPDSYQPIDASHPLNGRWRGKKQWQVYVDIPKGKVTYVRNETKSELSLSILKIGLDYLVAYAPKTYFAQQPTSSAPGFTDPFEFEKLASCDDVARQTPEGPIVVASLTLFIASPKTKTMDGYRRLTDSDELVREFLSADRQVWQDLSDVKKYRLFERYRYATAQSPR